MMPSAHISRRQALQQASLVALAPTLPLFLRRTAQAANSADDRVLVIVQLSGGNDGINTVVSYSDDGYQEHRQQVRLERSRLIRVDDRVGFHPQLQPMADLLNDGQLAVVQGVGYPNPNRSHDISMDIWQTARLDAEDHNSFGWIGRSMDQVAAPPDGSPHSILLGSEDPPIALRGRRSNAVSLAHLEDLRLSDEAKLVAPAAEPGSDLLAYSQRALLDAQATADLIDDVVDKSNSPAVAYPRTPLASRLKSIAQLIKADFATPVYYAIQPGYDTHAAQLAQHRRLLRELAGALNAFHRDLDAAGLGERVLSLCFSEFGRRVQENASLGTDHGTSGPVFLAGGGVRAGVIGHPPSLTDLEDGDLKMQFDFRQVYATILEDWLGIPPQAALAGSFEKLDFLRPV